MKSNKDHILERLWEKIKLSIPSHYSPIDHFAKTLKISRPQAYRLKNGTTDLKFDQILQLVERYGISIDEIIGVNANNVRVVQKSHAFYDYDGFLTYLTASTSKLMDFARSNNKEIIYIARDLPIFHIFDFDVLGKFKIHMWVKAANGSDLAPEINEFSPDNVPDHIINEGKKLTKLYHASNTIEYWTIDTLNTTLGQIRQELESGRLSYDLAREMIANLKSILTNYMQWCNTTYKENESSFTLYNAYFTTLQNIVIMHYDNGKYLLFENTNGVDFNISTDFENYKRTSHYIKSQQNESKLISGVDQTSRHKFFNQLLFKVKELDTLINISDR